MDINQSLYDLITDLTARLEVLEEKNLEKMHLILELQRHIDAVDQRVDILIMETPNVFRSK